MRKPGLRGRADARTELVEMQYGWCEQHRAYIRARHLYSDDAHGARWAYVGFDAAADARRTASPAARGGQVHSCGGGARGRPWWHRPQHHPHAHGVFSVRRESVCEKPFFLCTTGFSSH